MNEAYKNILNALSDASILLTGSGKVVLSNTAANELMSCQPDDYLNGYIQEFLHSSKEKFNEYLSMCCRSKQHVLGAFALHNSNGIQELKSKGSLLVPRKGKQEALVLFQLFSKLKSNIQFKALQERVDALNSQILMKQRIEYDLRSQKEWLQVTLSSIGDAVIITGVNGEVTFLNPMAEKMTGWNLGSALGRSLSEIFIIVDETTRLAVESPVQQVLSTHETAHLATNAVLISRGGAEFPIADTAAPIFLNDKLEGVVLVFHDVSMKRNLERQLIYRAERLEEQDRRKNTFLAMLAHELRNPLAPISNAIQLIKLNPQNAFPLEILERQSNHLASLVNGLLDVSRITQGKISIKKERIDIVKLVNEQCVDQQSIFDNKAIELSVSIPRSPIYVMADPTRITQVVGNLLVNAGKFTPRGGQVDIALTTNVDGVRLTVSDTGPGIEPALMSHLFEAFAQGSQSIDRAEGGLGLGLAMVKGIMELHGGKVTAESGSGGKGSTFTIDLPGKSQSLSIGAATVQKRGYGTKILLIEDNIDQAQTMSLLLESLGNTVHIANDGIDGLKKAKELIPDIVICDIGLPGMDGFEVARNIRNDELMASSLLVALTGYGHDDFVDKAKHAGFDQHLLKPIKISEIEDVLAINTLNQSRLT